MEEAKAVHSKTVSGMGTGTPKKESNGKLPVYGHNLTLKERSGAPYGNLSVTVNKPGCLNKWHEVRIKGTTPSGRSHCAACVYQDTYSLC